MSDTRRRSGQALLEFAVFGMVALAALGFLIRVGMRMNHDQEIRIMAFRRALAAARADNGTDMDAMATTVHQIAHRQMPDPTNGYMTMSRQRTEASAYVVWGERLTFAHEIDQDGNGVADDTRGWRTQPMVVVRSDNAESNPPYRQDNFPDDLEFGNLTWFANRGVVTRATSNSSSRATMTQTTGGASSLTSNVGTASTTKLNVIPSSTIASSVGSSTTVNW